MAVALRAKRMGRERKMLERPNEDYVVHFPDDNLFKFDAYIIGPSDTLYSHKFVKIHFEIPNEYPLCPPKCKFVQHGGGRIHPNLYVDGKVCLSILGTWQGEKWATAMTCQTVLITIRSLLDNKPYTHEPGQRDKPSFNEFVQYGTWRWLLLDYVRNEQEPTFKQFLQTHIANHGDAMRSELRRQAVKNIATTTFTSSYGHKHNQVANYPALERDLERCVEECRTATSFVADPKEEAVVTTRSVEDGSAHTDDAVVIIDDD